MATPSTPYEVSLNDLASNSPFGEDSIFSRKSREAALASEQQAGSNAQAAPGQKVFVYRLSGGDAVRAARADIETMLRAAQPNVRFPLEIGADGSLRAVSEVLLKVSTTRGLSSEKAQATALAFIKALQAANRAAIDKNATVPELFAGKPVVLNAVQINAPGTDRPQHWEVSLRQELPVARNSQALAPTSAGTSTVWVGGNGRNALVVGIDSSLPALQKPIESDTLHYGSEETQYATNAGVTAEMLAATQQPDVVYKLVQGGVLAPFWLMTDGEKPATEEGVGGEEESDEGSGDDFFLARTGEYLGRSLKGTGEAGAGKIRILNNMPDYITITGKKYVSKELKEFGSCWIHYSLNKNSNKLIPGTTLFLFQKIFSFYNDEFLREKHGNGYFPTPPYGYSRSIFFDSAPKDGNGDQSVMFFSTKDEGMHLTVQSNGLIDPDLDCYQNLKNGILHEYFHLVDFKTKRENWLTDERHMEIFLEQIKDINFRKVTPKWKWGMLVRCVHYLELANKNQNANFDFDKLKKWVIDINNLSKITGYYISYEVWAKEVTFSINPL